MKRQKKGRQKTKVHLIIVRWCLWWMLNGAPQQNVQESIYFIILYWIKASHASHAIETKNHILLSTCDRLTFLPTLPYVYNNVSSYSSNPNIFLLQVNLKSICNVVKIRLSLCNLSNLVLYWIKSVSCLPSAIVLHCYHYTYCFENNKKM